MSYETVLYETDGAVATITLNRPERLNTIVPPLPEELEQAVIQANRDPAVRVIILRGAGRAFCAGFDFSEDLDHFKDVLYTGGRWDPGKDMIAATSAFSAPVPKFMSL
ncbi:MAG: enoyl-CoA hydratase-related protein, partial [candidate division NC10 bacterium]